MAFVWSAVLLGLLFCTSVCRGKFVTVFCELAHAFVRNLYELGRSKVKEQGMEVSHKKDLGRQRTMIIMLITSTVSQAWYILNYYT